MTFHLRPTRRGCIAALVGTLEWRGAVPSVGRQASVERRERVALNLSHAYSPRAEPSPAVVVRFQDLLRWITCCARPVLHWLHEFGG